jgi:hypothetical protein
MTREELIKLAIKREARRRSMREQRCMDGGYLPGWNVTPMRVLVDWHTDEHGCRSRTLGREGAEGGADANRHG